MHCYEHHHSDNITVWVSDCHHSSTLWSHNKGQQGLLLFEYVTDTPNNPGPVVPELSRVHRSHVVSTPHCVCVRVIPYNLYECIEFYCDCCSSLVCTVQLKGSLGKLFKEVTGVLMFQLHKSVPWDKEAWQSSHDIEMYRMKASYILCAF